MSNKRVYSKPGPNGKTLHYNSSGKFVGSSFKSFNGNVKHLDSKGKYAGTSFKAPSGAMKHFDANGKYTGASIDSVLGGQIHFDAKGRPVGRSSEGFGGRYSTRFTGEGEERDEKNVHIGPSFSSSPVNNGDQEELSKKNTILGVVGLIVIVALVIGYWWLLGPLFPIVILLFLLAM